MRISGGKLLLEMLRLHGVDVVFGLPGETTLGLYREWEKFDGIRHILTHDERSAAYMAEAYAKATGRVGVHEAPSPGGAHPLPGVIESQTGSVPTICFTSDVPYNADKRNMLSGFDQTAVYRAVTKESILITKASDIPHLVRRAFRVALSDRPGAVHVRVPMDIYVEEAEVDDLYADPSMALWPQDRPIADLERIEAAADLLRAAKHPVIVCGQGALVSNAGDEVAELAELLHAPVGCTMTGKGTISEEEPWSLRLIGARGGTSFSNAFLLEADAVFFVGTNTDSAGTDAWKLPPNVKCDRSPRIVQLDVSRVEAGNNYQTEVCLIGDAKATLSLLLDVLKSKGGNGASEYKKEQVAAAMEALESSIVEAVKSNETPINAIRFVRELAARMPEKSLVLTEPSTGSIFSAAYMVQKTPGRWFMSNYSMGALGYVIPAVVGAAVARPDHTIVGLGGDGSFHFNCGELETWARYGLDIKYVVFNNDVFGWIRGEIEYVYSAKPFATDFGRVDYCKVAEGFGVKAYRIDDPSGIAGTLDEAFSARGPVLIEIRTLPEDVACPPIPRWVKSAREKGLSCHY